MRTSEQERERASERERDRSDKPAKWGLGNESLKNCSLVFFSYSIILTLSGIEKEKWGSGVQIKPKRQLFSI